MSILFWHKSMAFWKPWCFCLILSLPLKLHLCTRRNFTPLWKAEYGLLLCGPVVWELTILLPQPQWYAPPHLVFVVSSQILCCSKLIALTCSMQVFNRNLFYFRDAFLNTLSWCSIPLEDSDFLLLSYVVSRLTLLCLPYSSLPLLTLCSFSWLLLIAQVFLFPSFIFRYYIPLFVFISPNLDSPSSPVLTVIALLSTLLWYWAADSPDAES